MRPVHIALLATAAFAGLALAWRGDTELELFALVCLIFWLAIAAHEIRQL